MLLRIFLCVMLVFVFSSSVTFADTVTLDAMQDNVIYGDSQTNSNGSGDFFFAGQNGGATPRRGLIQFDLSTLPANAVITNVTLDLFASQVSVTDAFDISMHRLTSAWGESTSDANGGEGGGTAAVTGDATWQHTFFADQFWNSPGGDFVGASSATTSVSTTGAYSWSGPGLADDVQGWLDGGFDNFGWILIGDETLPSTAKRFNSRSNAGTSPSLTIEFTAIPEPSTACLLGLASLSMLVRRRK